MSVMADISAASDVRKARDNPIDQVSRAGSLRLLSLGKELTRFLDKSLWPARLGSISQ